MGIVRAVLSSVDSVLQEQWLEYFTCDSLDSETLIRRGVKRIGARSANSRRDDNIITNGSVLAVADGQCVIVTSQALAICSMRCGLVLPTMGCIFAGWRRIHAIAMPVGVTP